MTVIREKSLYTPVWQIIAIFANSKTRPNVQRYRHKATTTRLTSTPRWWCARGSRRERQRATIQSAQAATPTTRYWPLCRTSGWLPTTGCGRATHPRRPTTLRSSKTRWRTCKIWPSFASTICIKANRRHWDSRPGYRPSWGRWSARRESPSWRYAFRGQTPTISRIS